MIFMLLMESLITEDGQNAWNDLTCNTCSPAILDPFIEELIVIEKLSYHKVCTCIYFLFKVSDIIFTTLCC